MKLSIVPILSAITTSSALVVTPALQQNVELPDSRFSVQLLFDSPLLPVNPTFAVITQFMSKVARSGFEQVHESCTYRSRKYPTVAITTHSSIETRFLLWGIYLAVIDMVKYGRFNDVVVNLIWDRQLVGQIAVLVNTDQGWPKTSPNDTSGLLNDGESLKTELLSNRIRESSVERLHIPTPGNKTLDAVTISNASADSLVNSWTVCSNPTTLTTGHPSNGSLLSTLAVNFEVVEGATPLKRNAVFLTFYAAVLHAARFPAGDQLVHFNSKAPDVDLRVHMIRVGVGCSVRLSTLVTPTVNVKIMTWS